MDGKYIIIQWLQHIISHEMLKLTCIITLVSLVYIFKMSIFYFEVLIQNGISTNAILLQLLEYGFNWKNLEILIFKWKYNIYLKCVDLLNLNKFFSVTKQIFPWKKTCIFWSHEIFKVIMKHVLLSCKSVKILFLSEVDSGENFITQHEMCYFDTLTPYQTYPSTFNSVARNDFPWIS